MSPPEWKTYKNARREALVVVAILLVMMIYILTYCYLRGQLPADGKLILATPLPSDRSIIEALFSPREE